MRLRITLSALIALTLLPTSISWGQTVLDDVRQDILRESREEIKSINEEIDRRKKIYTREEELKKSAFEDKILKAQKLHSIEQQKKVISQSENLLNAIQEQTDFKPDKRWRYEELLKIYAEKPIEELPIEVQEQTLNERLATATSELIMLLKKKASEEAKKKRGESYEPVETDQDLVAQLNQYTQLVKRINSTKVAQQEKIAANKNTVVQSTEELIEALKKEAIRRAELKASAKGAVAEKGSQLKKFEGIAGLHYGYDTNINADTHFEGGQFVRNYFSLDWLPSLNQYFGGDLGVWYLADNYVEDQDVTFKMAAGKASVKAHPFGNNDLTLEPGYEWTDTHYPDNPSVSTKESKLFFNTRHQFWAKWSQELNYEGSKISNNQNRLARIGNGDDKPDTPLVKLRHTIEYNLNFPQIYKTLIKLKQKGRKQVSNDAFNDFYDYYSYQVTGELGRGITEKIYAKASIDYEQKNYSYRTVDTHQIAQEDQTYTQKATLFYFLANDWMLNYTWSRTKTDSNDPTYDYEKISHIIGAYYSF